MIGGESLVQTLVACGVDVCFANPGTTEMHLVHALDRVPSMKSVLSLFEGVCTGAADGYGRMTGRPAMTLLHLGPGLANGIANLHNARRARTPVVNVVGDHATEHVQFNAPLTSDIESLSEMFSAWVRSSTHPDALAGDGADAVAAALTPRPEYHGQVATLIVPSDVAWSPTTRTSVPKINPAPRLPVDDGVINETVALLDDQSVLFLDGPGASPPGMDAAARISAVTGCKLVVTTFAARVDSGPGEPVFTRLPYFPEQARAVLKGYRKIVLAGAVSPVTFFGYPNQPGSLVPDGCRVQTLAKPEEDVVTALEAVADALNAPRGAGARNPKSLPAMPSGVLTAEKAADVIANLAPEGCIAALDTGGGKLAHDPLLTAVPHTWLPITGGSIGDGGPVGTGAAIACPDRRVFALLGDGAAMYTLQALWTQARHSLNVTTVIYSNRSYGILQYEYERLNLPALSEQGAALFDLSNPDIHWVDLARGLGVPGAAVDTCEAFADAFAKSIAQPGPFLIEARTTPAE